MFISSHIVGVEKVLEAIPRLNALALEAGQQGLLNRLSFSFSLPNFGDKLPHLILLHCGTRVCAAAILLEYRFLKVRTGIFVPIDIEDDLTVLASPENRGHAAEKVAHYLLSRRAKIVFLSLAAMDRNFEKPLPDSVQSRQVRRTLPLLTSTDETLARMGSKTRRNLRLAARRVKREHAARFIANVDLTESALMDMNRGSAYPVTDQVAQWRYRSTRLHPDGFLSGLLAADGRWLSLLGGRRIHATTIVDWQMNRTDLGSLSVGTAMRFMQMEIEIQRGATALQFNGGTQHSMQHAFYSESFTDLLWVKWPFTSRGLRSLAFRQIAPSNSLKAMLMRF